MNYTLPLDQLPDPLPIVPLTKPFDVTIRPPGSKSITCRAYVLAALAKGESRLVRPLRAEDPDRLLDALCTLGAAARWEGDDVIITGVDGRFPRGGSVNLGDGGAPTRFMIAAACLASEPVIVDGSRRMRERPIAEGVDLLRQLGARIEYFEADGRLPVRVLPSRLQGSELEVGRTQSSQFVSGALLIAPFLDHDLTFNFPQSPTSPSYLLLTINLLRTWGVEITTETEESSREQLDLENWSRINAELPSRLGVRTGATQVQRYEVEVDASSAAYWFTAAAICARCRSEVVGLDWPPTQPDCLMARVLQHANLIDLTAGTSTPSLDRASWYKSWIVERGRRTGKVKADCSLFPDGAMALAVVAAMMKGPSTFSGLSTLRVKETDRIAALANELRRIGCTVEATDDSITIDPSTRHDDPVIIETYNDHRMAMAFAVLGLARPNISIAHPACVRKSYPAFWQDFAKLYG